MVQLRGALGRWAATDGNPLSGSEKDQLRAVSAEPATVEEMAGFEEEKVRPRMTLEKAAVSDEDPMFESVRRRVAAEGRALEVVADEDPRSASRGAASREGWAAFH